MPGEAIVATVVGSRRVRLAATVSVVLPVARATLVVRGVVRVCHDTGFDGGE
jgi:hypothetical protein